jgi:hypothetical protein
MFVLQFIITTNIVFVTYKLWHGGSYKCEHVYVLYITCFCFKSESGSETLTKCYICYLALTSSAFNSPIPCFRLAKPLSATLISATDGIKYSTHIDVLQNTGRRILKYIQP